MCAATSCIRSAYVAYLQSYVSLTSAYVSSTCSCHLNLIQYQYVGNLLLVSGMRLQRQLLAVQRQHATTRSTYVSMLQRKLLPASTRSTYVSMLQRKLLALQRQHATTRSTYVSMLQRQLLAQQRQHATTSSTYVSMLQRKLTHLGS